MQMRKRLFSVLLIMAMVIGLMPVTAFAADGDVLSSSVSQFSDIPDNWSTVALQNAVANGLLSGAGGKIMPNDNLTRSQMATVIVRAFGASVKGNLTGFSDIKSADWFADSMAKAFQMGVIKGSNGKMNPNNSITRQEVFVILARAFKLQSASTINNTFTDVSQISDWAKGEVYALVNAGYIQGANGKLDPGGLITRAEFAQTLDNILKQYVNKPGEITTVSAGNIMVNTSGVTLKNLTVSGDLIIGDGVGDGEVILDNVKVTGRMVVRGGGENSIIIRGSSSVSSVIVSRVDGTVSVKVEGDANVEIIYIDDGSDDVNIEGTVGNVEIKAPNIVVNAVGATINNLDIAGANSRIVIDANSSVNTVGVQQGASNTTLQVAGTVTNITTAAANTGISGSGTVTMVEAQAGATGARIETPKTSIVVGAGVTGVTGGGGTAISGGTTTNNNATGTGTTTPAAPPPSGGGDGGSSNVAVSAINVTPTTMTLTAGGATETITATVDPSNATHKSVTWSSSNEAVATVVGA